MTPLLRPLLLAVALISLDACSKPASTPAPAAAAKHEHRPPHGGTAIVLGDEIYHLELVLDATAGKLSAYVFDGEMENFIRVAAPSFEIVATVGGEKKSLVFTAIANPATGEKIGDTALFEAQAAWLKSTPTFDATLSSLTIRGTPFTAVAFNFPKGNDQD